MLSQVVILVGGLGTRLGELTATMPKPLLPVGDKPFLDHLIQEVSRFGFKRITLLAGRFGEKVAAIYDGQTIEGLPVDVVIEPRPMGTGGALVYAASQQKLDDAFVLMNGDSWIDANLTGYAHQWTQFKKTHPSVQAQLLLQTVPDAARFGTVEIKDGVVQRFSEKDAQAKAGIINAGVYILDKAIVEGFSLDKPVSLEVDVLPELVKQKRVTGVLAPTGSYFIDIGIPDTYAQAQQSFIAQRYRPAIFFDRDGTLNEDYGYTHKFEDLIWKSGAKEAIRLANDAGYYVFVVTNQAGVARGFYTEEAVHHFFDAMQQQLSELGAHIDAYEYCPYHEDGSVKAYCKTSDRRKPAPGMILDLAKKWPVNMTKSVLIGDSDADIGAATAAGIRSIRYETGSLLNIVRTFIEKEKANADQ